MSKKYAFWFLDMSSTRLVEKTRRRPGLFYFLFTGGRTGRGGEEGDGGRTSPLTFRVGGGVGGGGFTDMCTPRYNLGIVITAYAIAVIMAALISAILQKYRLELFLSLLMVQIVAHVMYFS